MQKNPMIAPTRPIGIRLSENIRKGEDKGGRALCAAEASELSHEEVCVEEEVDEANFSERSQDLLRNS
jgi:hypothetical protein